MSETVLPTTQTTSPIRAHCRRLSPSLSAMWVPRRPEPRPHRPEPRPHRRQTGGNCIIRATTRRRHADRMLLMVQNPHHYPWCHAPTLVSCSLTVVTLSHWCGAARRDADKRQKGVTDRTVAGERATNSTTGLVSDEAKHPIGDHPTRSDRAQCSRSGGIFPHGSNAPKRVERSRSGVILPMVRILSEALRRERASPTLLP